MEIAFVSEYKIWFLWNFITMPGNVEHSQNAISTDKFNNQLKLVTLSFLKCYASQVSVTPIDFYYIYSSSAPLDHSPCIVTRKPSLVNSAPTGERVAISITTSRKWKCSPIDGHSQVFRPETLNVRMLCGWIATTSLMCLSWNSFHWISNLWNSKEDRAFSNWPCFLWTSQTQIYKSILSLVEI